MRGKMTRRKQFDYWDLKIYHPKTRRVYYLRNKLNRRTAELTMTVRTHTNGKGKAMTKPVSAVQLSERTRVLLWQKINKKFPFCFVIFQEIPE